MRFSGMRSIWGKAGDRMPPYSTTRQMTEKFAICVRLNVTVRIYKLIIQLWKKFHTIPHENSLRAAPKLPFSEFCPPSIPIVKRIDAPLLLCALVRCANEASHAQATTSVGWLYPSFACAQHHNTSQETPHNEMSIICNLCVHNEHICSSLLLHTYPI